MERHKCPIYILPNAPVQVAPKRSGASTSIPIHVLQCYQEQSKNKPHHQGKRSECENFLLEQPEMAPLQPYRLFRLLQEVMSLRSSTIFWVSWSHPPWCRQHRLLFSACPSSADLQPVWNYWQHVNKRGKKSTYIYLYVYISDVLCFIKVFNWKKKKKNDCLFSDGYKPTWRCQLVRVLGVPARAGAGQRTQRSLPAFWWLWFCFWNFVHCETFNISTVLMR